MWKTNAIAKSVGWSLSSQTVALVGVCTLIIVAPFEALRPLADVGGQSVSTVEAALLVVVVMWAGAVIREGVVPRLITPLTVPSALFLAAMLVAAILAPEHRSNALKMTGRFGLAFSVYLLSVHAASLPRCRRTVGVAAMASGVCISVLVLLEYSVIDSVAGFLSAFRPFVAHVGDQVRAGGPFQYPTIASMYLEIVFAIGLGLFVMSLDRRHRALIALIGLLLLLVSQSIVLTFTRAGLITMAASLTICMVLRYRFHGRDRAVVAMAVLALGIVGQGLATRSLESVGLRMTSEGQEAWYRAAIQAPPEVSIRTGATTTVPILVTNGGRKTWDSTASPPVRLSYHWLLADEDTVVSWEGLRTDFPRSVNPGDTVSLLARVKAPVEPGRYRILWDIEQENRLWFSTEPGAVVVATGAEVHGAGVGTLGTQFRPMPLPAVRAGRRTLWRAAFRMVPDHLLTGVGPDNFRLRYGQYADLPRADTRVHSNNMYLEVLTGGGLIAAGVFAWLVWRAVLLCVRASVPTDGSRPSPASAGFVAAAGAIALHGLVDSFLSFSATYILFAIVFGIVSGSNWSLDAHRV